MARWKAICDRCGFEYWSDELRKEWTGLMVCRADWEPRHPQDTIRAKPDRQAPPWVRPDPEESFVATDDPVSITSSASVSVAEDAQLSHALTAGASVTWTIAGGDDRGHFQITGSELQWFGDGTKDYENPTDWDASNTYVVIVRATETGGIYSQQTITVTVTNV